MEIMRLLLLICVVLVLRVNADCEEQPFFIAGEDGLTNGMDSMTNTYLDSGTWTIISDNYQPFTLFGNLTVNSTAYMGSSVVPFGGLYYQVDSNFSQSSNIVIEYWNTVTSSWTSTLAMAMLAQTPFYTFGNVFFENVQCEKLTIGNTTNWGLSTLNGITDYWLRFRIIAPLSSNIVLEQLFRFYQQFEVDDFGYVHFTDGIVNTRFVDFQFNGALTPVYASNFPIFGLDYPPNVITHATFSVRLPADIDTSKQLKLAFDWTANCTGNVVWELHTLPLPNGNPIYLVNQPHAATEQTLTSIPIAVDPNTQIHTLILFPIDSLVMRPVSGAPDVLFLNLRRNGAASADTCSKNAVLYTSTLSYFSINLGAHQSLYWTQEVY